tara:strand:- start:325 stop:567 length:243 start_codon:yes stop_codon:yes gene_type:complete
MVGDLIQFVLIQSIKSQAMDESAEIAMINLLSAVRLERVVSGSMGLTVIFEKVPAISGALWVLAWPRLCANITQLTITEA